MIFVLHRNELHGTGRFFAGRRHATHARAGTVRDWLPWPWPRREKERNTAGVTEKEREKRRNEDEWKCGTRLSRRVLFRASLPAVEETIETSTDEHDHQVGETRKLPALWRCWLARGHDRESPTGHGDARRLISRFRRFQFIKLASTLFADYFVHRTVELLHSSTSLLCPFVRRGFWKTDMMRGRCWERGI